MTRETAVLATLLIYKLALVLIGMSARRRTHDADDFYLAGRKLGPLVAAVSASASSSSAWTLLGVSGAAYAWGISALWLFPSCVGGFLLNWYLLAPRLQKLSRSQGSLTVTEAVSGAPGEPWQRALSLAASCIILVSLGTYVASQFQGAGKMFSETFELSLTASILIGGAVVVFYTLLGGFWAVSLTDTLQGLLMAAVSLLLPLVALAAVGGPRDLWSGLHAVPVEGYLSLTRNLQPVAGAGFVLGLLGIGLGYPGQPHVVNRFMALDETSGNVVRARRIAVGWAVVVYSGMLLVGWCGRILHAGLDDPEVVFVTLTNSLLSPVLSGVVLAAVLSAIMSTADSQLLVAASSVTHDLKLGGTSSAGLLSRSRVVVLLLSMGAMVGAVYGTREIFSQVLFAWAAIGSAFGPLLLVVTFRPKVGGGYRLAAMITGFLLSVLAFYLLPDSHLWKGSMERVFPFVAALAIALYGAGRLRSKS